MGSRYKVYTDGACSGNPGPGGFGVIIQKQIGSGFVEQEFSEGYGMTTNNRMELMSVIFALRQIPDGSDVTVITDSQYVANAIELGWLKNWISNGWKTSRRTPVENKDLWMTYLIVTKNKSIRFEWVKGHNKHSENERCDTLATSMYHNMAYGDSRLKEDSVYLITAGYEIPETIRPVTKLQASYLAEIGQKVPAELITNEEY